MIRSHRGATITLSILILIGMVFLLWPKFSIAPEGNHSFILSEDHKSILSNGNEVLSVDHDVILNFFQSSELCNSSNIQNTPTRDAFCNETDAYKASTEFKSIAVSPQKNAIGFTIQTSELSPDTVVGFYQAETVSILTSYYLGNEFLSFSPQGDHFIYQGNCWEGRCGLFVGKTENAEIMKTINNPEEGVDARTENAIFIEWTNQNEIRYQLGQEIKTETIE